MIYQQISFHTLAWMGFFTSMEKQVFFKVQLASKFLLTHLAWVWFFTSMDEQVFYKGQLVSKFLLAHLAWVWFFTSRDAKVFYKVWLVTKCLFTHLAWIRFFTCMDEEVSYKVFFLGKCLLAHVAYMGCFTVDNICTCSWHIIKWQMQTPYTMFLDYLCFMIPLLFTFSKKSRYVCCLLRYLLRTLFVQHV